MAYNYAPIKATADRLITNFGRSITLRKRERTTLADAGKPWRGPSAGDYDPDGVAALTGVFVTLGEGQDKFGRLSGLVDESLLKANEDAFLISATAVEALGIDPTTFDHVVEASGENFKIARVVELKPGNTALIYYVVLER